MWYMIIMLCFKADEEINKAMDELSSSDDQFPSPWFVLGAVVFWVIVVFVCWEIVKRI